MRGFNFNISSLFSGMGSNSPFSSFNLGDYASIKNGSYGKLMKAYYTEQKKDVTSDKTSGDKTTTSKPSKTKNTDTTGLTQMKKESDSLKTAADVLSKDDLWKQNNGEYDKDKIVSAVKSFADKYNNVVTQASKVNSKDIVQSVRYMSGLTSTMSKALSKVGVSVGTDGKLSVDEDTLKKANVSSVKALFSGAISYGSQTADRASEISREALMNSSMYNSNGTASSTMHSVFENWV